MRSGQQVINRIRPELPVLILILAGRDDLPCSGLREVRVGLAVCRQAGRATSIGAGSAIVIVRGVERLRAADWRALGDRRAARGRTPLRGSGDRRITLENRTNADYHPKYQETGNPVTERLPFLRALHIKNGILNA